MKQALTPLNTLSPAETPERRMLRDYLMKRRQTIIMELRHVDGSLIEMGVISEPTIKTHDERRAERHAKMNGTKEGNSG